MAKDKFTFRCKPFTDGKPYPRKEEDRISRDTWAENITKEDSQRHRIYLLSELQRKHPHLSFAELTHVLSPYN